MPVKLTGDRRWGYVAEEKAIKSKMDEIVKIVRYSSFVPEYQEKATIEKCVGIAVSKYFEWDTRIFYAFSRVGKNISLFQNMILVSPYQE